MQAAPSSLGSPARLSWLLLALCLSAQQAPAQAGDFEREPILYSTAPAENAVEALLARLAEDGTLLRATPERGYLASLLEALEVPASSQLLVFSKTSFQRGRISPRRPRAIYFNDDLYVGYCQGGEVLEISAYDTQLGTVFYTLDQRATEQPSFTREGEDCLTCHVSGATGDIPGNLVRSVFTDARGMPILSAGTFRTDHTSPFEERWGGWYVTGSHGAQTHMGNWLVRDERKPQREGNASGQNVTDLSERLNLAPYLTPHSDLVALLVFEHQTEAHNRLARALFTTRQALHYQDKLNEELGEPPDQEWSSVIKRIQSVGDDLAEYLLLSGEAPLSDPVAGTSAFAEEFAARGPFDRAGRSLRELDLETRLFRYPCSYLIYSKGFAQLPARVKARTLSRMHAVLTGEDTSPEFGHLSAADRRATLEILRDTLPDLPAEWRD
jgi:hypothetical protein